MPRRLARAHGRARSRRPSPVRPPPTCRRWATTSPRPPAPTAPSTRPCTTPPPRAAASSPAPTTGGCSPSSSTSPPTRPSARWWPRCCAADDVWLYEDSVLVKEPGTEERTAFHQDMAYFHLDGDQVCTTWVPLDPVTAESGAVRYVRRLAPRPHPLPAEPVRHHHGDPRHRRRGGARLRRRADVEQRGAARIVSFDTQPGDVVDPPRPHHPRGPRQRQRHPAARGPSACATPAPAPCSHRSPGAPGKAHHDGVAAGAPLDDEHFPRAWPAPA